jgi:prepilin-type N-terminal cleavage/methylation domain-containing protein
MRREIGQPRGRGRRFRRGVTLLELSVAIIIVGILVAFVVPSFTQVTEQNHVDAATQYLRSVWSAERVYWLEHRTFTNDFSTLNTLGLIDPKIAGGDDGYFLYGITNVSDETFTVGAIRNGSSLWTGTLSITQDGEVTGFVHHGAANVLTPPDI